MLLMNNVLLTVAAAAVLLGTLYPLVLDALDLGKISVGPPYFDTVFVPLMAPALFLMGIGPLARWREASLPSLAQRLKWAFGLAVVCALVLPALLGEWTAMRSFGLLLAFWVFASTATTLVSKLRAQPGPGLLARLRGVPRAQLGMLLAHAGIGVFVIGVTMVKSYEVERDLKMDPGDTALVGGYTFRFDGVGEVRGPNYTAAARRRHGAAQWRAGLRPEPREARLRRPAAADDRGLDPHRLHARPLRLARRAGRRRGVDGAHLLQAVRHLDLGRLRGDGAGRPAGRARSPLPRGRAQARAAGELRAGAEAEGQETPAAVAGGSAAGRARMKRFLLPLGIFIVLVGFLAVGLRLNPREVPSPLINKPAPPFTLPELTDPQRTFSQKDMLGKVWLLNVWASWCVSCREEHPVLVEFSKRNIVPVYGLNYKDERKDALAWLARLGNPYTMSIMDRDGRIGIDYGVYGVPETYVIDKQGVIRYKQIGPVTPEILDAKIVPLVKKLQG